MTQDPTFKAVIDETITWMARELRDDSGGLFSSIDADSEGEEGAFYVWTPEQIREVLGQEQAQELCQAYGVRRGGNFESGTSVLHRVTEDDPMVEARQKLFEARQQRVPPATDTKVLSSHNGLAITGLVRAWEATGQDEALALAREIASFLEREMIQDKRIYRVFSHGRRQLEGTLEDYAFVAEGLLALAEATEEENWWNLALGLIQTMLDNFHEEIDGVSVFYISASNAPNYLIHRPVSSTDSATPAAAAVAVDCLVRVGLATNDQPKLELAKRYLQAHLPRATRSPFAAARLLLALDLLLHGNRVQITAGEGRELLLEAARRTFAPTTIFAGPWAQEEVDIEGPAAIVCRNQTCSAPLTTADELIRAVSRGCGPITDQIFR
jgi:uncharacterized protein